MKKSDLILVIALAIFTFASFFYVANRYADAGRLCVNYIDEVEYEYVDSDGNTHQVIGTRKVKSYPKIMFVATLGTLIVSAEILRVLAVVEEVEKKRDAENEKTNEAQANEELAIEKPVIRMSDDEDKISDNIISYLFSGVTDVADEQ